MNATQGSTAKRKNPGGGLWQHLLHTDVLAQHMNEQGFRHERPKYFRRNLRCCRWVSMHSLQGNQTNTRLAKKGTCSNVNILACRVIVPCHLCPRDEILRTSRHVARPPKRSTVETTAVRGRPSPPRRCSPDLRRDPAPPGLRT